MYLYDGFWSQISGITYNDGLFAESIFRHCRYGADWATEDFNGIDNASAWGAYWCNIEYEPS